MNPKQFLHPQWQESALANSGLNLQAVFSLTNMPDTFLQKCQSYGIDLSRYNQVILLAHGGSLFWQKMQQFIRLHPEPDSIQHPVDEFSMQLFRNFCEKMVVKDYSMLYPRLQQPFYHFDLQSLGAAVGWHSPTPFKVGINPVFGSWFAYRVLALSQSDFLTTPLKAPVPVCTNCAEKACIKACPVQALSEQDYDWQSCFAYRKSDASRCKNQCLARLACPVQKQHGYSNEQIQYHYSLSLKHL